MPRGLRAHELLKTLGFLECCLFLDFLRGWKQFVDILHGQIS